MASRQQAPIVLRAQRACLAAAAVGMLLTAGCNHRRSALRPVLRAPSAIVAPSACTSCNGAGGGCSSCGGTGAAAVVSPGATVIRGGSSISSEPGVRSSGSGALPSEVELTPPAPTGTTRPRSDVERPPTASPEPLLDEIPAATSKSKTSRLRPSIESTPRDKDVPDLTSPGSSSTSLGTRGNSLRTTATSGVVRRASASSALSGYFLNDDANDLYYPNKVDRPWKYVIVHHSATEVDSYSSIDAEHRKLQGLDGCGYHFVIGNGTGSGDGQIEVSQRWVNQKHGVHCRNARRADMDEYGIGVCLVGDFEKAPPTPRQQAALKALLGYLSERYKIGQDRLETHSHMAATQTVCPGRFFPVDALDVAPIPSTAQADASPQPTTRRAVPTAWRLREGEVQVPRLTPPAR